MKKQLLDWWQTKIKMNIAEFIHARTSTCWAEMVNWVFGYASLKDVLISGDKNCVMEAANNHGCGSCYCGKYINSKHGYNPDEAPSACIDVNPDINKFEILNF